MEQQNFNTFGLEFCERLALYDIVLLSRLEPRAADDVSDVNEISSLKQDVIDNRDFK